MDSGEFAREGDDEVTARSLLSGRVCGGESRALSAPALAQLRHYSTDRGGADGQGHDPLVWARCWC